MSTSRLTAGLCASVALACLAGAATLPAAPAFAADASPQCLFDEYTPTAVQPYMSDADMPYGDFQYFDGAQLYFPARDGLTREWLEASITKVLARHKRATQAGQATGSAGCSDAPDAKDVDVRVSSVGEGFWVQLIAHDDADTAHALLNWARDIVSAHQPHQAHRHS